MLRQYLQRSADLGKFSAAKLDEIAQRIKDRPEKSSAGVRQMRSMQQFWPVLHVKIERAAMISDGTRIHA